MQLVKTIEKCYLEEKSVSDAIQVELMQDVFH